VATGTAKVALAALETPLVGDTAMSLGQVRAGGALSATVSGNEQLVVRPPLLIAMQVTVVVVRTLKRVLFEAGHESDCRPESGSAAVTLEANETRTSGRLSEACVV